MEEEAPVGNFNVGRSILLPYLLARGIKRIDFVMISHFDSDHIEGLLYLMNEIKVKNVIFTTVGQRESDNFEQFKNVVRTRKIKLTEVKVGDKLNIEKDLYLNILWPEKEKKVMENEINNNSIVCKLCYNNFSMLFTGDIEKEAEMKILERYKKRTEELKSTILKIPHHGSKTSSTEEFLEFVNPKAALIGVGKNNKFGHPNVEVLERLKELRSRCV